ncbi:hypothetical protein [Microbulbifer sp. GL-2]|uniref:hypothetical protein n=1 Tax=Microbulbifer sp. GL-2 TaxID=2591606 RepID=UPI001165C707|nr:hypothetical protein [Microbulbifer sp. GL-2]BBM02058.1 hypothetical protein GL2_21320 [Microbulbifer sp. GL-2]
MKKLFLFLMAVILSSCTSVYVPPNMEGNATVEIQQENLKLMQIYLNGDDCSNKVFMPEESNFLIGKNKPLVLTANKEIAFHVESNDFYSYCSQKVSFLPKPDQQYILKFKTASNKCYVNLVRKEIDDGKVVEVSEPTFRKRVPRIPVMESGSFCKA